MGEEKMDGCDIHGVLLNTDRLKIMRELTKKPMHVAELARKLNMDRGKVMYHLEILEIHQYLNGAHKILNTGNSRGRGIHRFEVTEIAKERIAELAELLKSMV